MPFDEGTNGTSCVLTAPSARSLSSANLSPLTTLLQTYMEQSGGGVADTEKWFKVQTGINSSPLDDYSTTLRNRAAFAAGNKVNYLSCYERRSDATSLNCALIGSGTYKIEALGDARAMSFQNQPTATLAGGYAQVMIERGGKIYYGFQVTPGSVSSSMRLNLTATNALFTKLGLPPLVP